MQIKSMIKEVLLIQKNILYSYGQEEDKGILMIYIHVIEDSELRTCC